MSEHFKFEIKRLVLVDSAGFCYVELPVDEHAILLGEGNLGKSSLLNSLRLFMLPENNFKNSKNKFAFATPKRDGYYDNQESFGHYFPSKYSFLILEVSNNMGGKNNTHCQILHRDSGHLSYQRILTPLKYEQIRHLFWDGADAENGIGFRVENLTSASLFKTLKQMDSHTTSVKDPNKLKSLLYANDFINPAAMRYSVFPLAESDAARIESLRTLILLLFDMNASSEPVAKAVANIIEADKKFVDDVLDFNIEQFLGKHNDLKQQDLDLTQVENMQDKFGLLGKQFEQYQQLADSEQHFGAFVEQLKAKLLQMSQQMKACVGSAHEAKLQAQVQGKQCKALAYDHTSFNGAQKELQNQHRKATAAVHKANELLLGYGDMEVQEVAEIIKEDIANRTERLAALENETQKVLLVNKLQERIGSNQRELLKRQARLANQHLGLEHQLPTSSWQVLTAINKKLALVNPARELETRELQAFTAFTDLFSDDDASVALYGERFNKQTSALAQDDEAVVRHLVTELEADNRELKKLQQGHSNAINKANDISNLKRDVDRAEHEFGLIERLSYQRDRLKELDTELAEKAIDINQLETELKQAEALHLIFQAEHNRLETKREHVATTVGQLKELDKHCQNIITAQPRLEMVVGRQYPSAPMFELIDSEVDTLSRNLNLVTELGNTLVQGLRLFIIEQVIGDEQGIIAESPDAQAISATFGLLKDTFNNLGGRRNILVEQVRTHNESVQGYANILKKNHEHIKRFENQLNRDFSEININDLVGIEVDIHIDQRFVNLVTEVSNVDLDADSMLPDKFYQRLQSFADNFFVNGVTAQLTMDKVVTNLSYRTRKALQTGWQTKQQSNSTTALINLKLVQILLRKLRANGCFLMFPLVLDEVSTVDVKQFDWLLDDIKRSGFNLFAASTHSASPELIYKIGRHHELGEMRTSKPYSKDRSLVYWGGAESFETSKGFNAEQFGMFDEQVTPADE
jgi:hypothetical protein